MNRASSGEPRPIEHEDRRDDRQPERPPLLEELLAEQHQKPGHRPVDLAWPDEAAAVELVRRSWTDQLEEDILERRPGLLERGQDHARGDDERQDLARGRVRVRVTSTRTAPARDLHRSSSTAQPSAGRASAATAVALAERRDEPEDRPRVRREQLRERAFRHEPPAVEDRDAVADPLDVGEDVGRDDDRRRAARLCDQLEEVAPALRVERADRLVEDQQLVARGARAWAMPSRCRMPPE